MNGHDEEQRGRWRMALRGMLILLPLVLLTFVGSGCAVNDISVASYESGANVKPTETASRTVLGSSPLPWDIVLAGVSDILTGARKKAIEGKVGYWESRSFTLFRLKNADSRSQTRSEEAAPGNGTASEEHEE